MSRVMLRLRKSEEIKYLSQLDLMRAFEYALRRAQAPVAYSEGFNPRPKMSFGTAVGCGVTSDDERIVVELASDIDAYELRERLNARLPDGLQVLDAEAVPEGAKSPISALNASRFRMVFSCDCDCSSVESAVRGILDSPEVRVNRIREKKGNKEVDIRPGLLAAEVTECSDDSAVIEIAVKMGEAGGANPRDFTQALGNRLANISVKRIHRIEQFHAVD